MAEAGQRGGPADDTVLTVREVVRRAVVAHLTPADARFGEARRRAAPPGSVEAEAEQALAAICGGLATALVDG